jgi:ferrous-iron efflux pump FieF
MDDNLTLRQAHNITDMIEDRIKERFPDTEIIIHPEPDQHRSGL